MEWLTHGENQALRLFLANDEADDGRSREFLLEICREDGRKAAIPVHFIAP
jgi:hypothetical protein